MKIKEAREVISTIIQWQMVRMGVTEVEECQEKTQGIDLEKYSLSDLMEANRKVKVNNDFKRKLQNARREKGLETKGISIQMTCDDRLISAIYTMLHFEANHEVVAIYKEKGIGVVEMKY